MNNSATMVSPSEFLKEIYPDNVYAEGFDDAVIGYDASSGQAIYDYDLCVKILMSDKNNLCNYEDAVEHMEYNVVGTKGLDNAPIFIHTLGYAKSAKHLV